MKIGIITNKVLAQYLIKTFEKIGYESYWISVSNTLSKILKDFKNCDIIYAHAPYELKVYLLAKLFQKKIVTHWIGTDAYLATNHFKFKIYARICNLLTDKQLVVSSHLKEEIATIGIKDIVVIPILPKFISSEISTIEHKNERFTILSYIIPNGFDFYGGTEILNLAKIFPDMDFWILAGDFSSKTSLKNVKFLGLIPPNEMDSIYDKCHVLLRYVKHDGMPKMLIEALQKGLQVVYNFPFPHTHYCTSFEQIESKLYELNEKYRINFEGRNYVLKNFCSKVNQTKFKNVFKELFEDK
jgi:glycosyltransferase involved in cell wall biosynthesis